MLDNLEIRQCTVAEIETCPNLAELFQEYADECSIDGMPPPIVKMELYRKLESSNTIRVWGAFYENSLIGLMAVLTTVIPHYGVSVTVSETFFVTKRYRYTGAGLILLGKAESYVDHIKSPGFLISAPKESILAEILCRKQEYVETNRVFFRKSKNV
jgi:hypothetical protein